MQNQDMAGLVMVINCGSSSLKFALYRRGESKSECEGLAEALNTPDATIKLSSEINTAYSWIGETVLANASHKDAITFIMDAMEQEFSLLDNLIAVGHRVVHGGEKFSSAVIIDSVVLEELVDVSDLAPLHNPANIMGIELIQARYPDVRQVAVFDTAFHQSMPETAYRYAVPSFLYEEHLVRRYGFHGTSHQYVAGATAEHLNKSVDQCSFITAHLGNGASVCAIRDGKSVDTSMGMTPLEGLVMGTRSGDIDPGIFAYLESRGMTANDINKMLNKQSGLLGLSGESNDMRTLQLAAERGNALATLAIDVFCFRLAKYIAAMRVSLDRCDGLIFTGGIGENSAFIRSKTVNQLKCIGFELNDEANKQRGADVIAIHSSDSQAIYITKTDEELMIANQSLALCMQQQEQK